VGRGHGGPSGGRQQRQQRHLAAGATEAQSRSWSRRATPATTIIASRPTSPCWRSWGFNTYRFSLEWARIEPAKGQFSAAEREHYRRVAATCRQHGLTPLITFNHFTVPRWFAAQGGWENPESPALFARYCDYAVKGVGDLAGAAATFNEPNIGLLLVWMLPPFILDQMKQAMVDAAKACNSPTSPAPSSAART
jgi:beta-glucosidase/6-phospho-beta-glucosidase/beta-galactosidase